MASILEAAVRYHVPPSTAKLMPSAVSSGLLCNHDGAWPHETLQRRRAGGGGRGARAAHRSPNGTCLESALHEGWLETALATGEL